MEFIGIDQHLIIVLFFFFWNCFVINIDLRICISSVIYWDQSTFTIIVLFFFF